MFPSAQMMPELGFSPTEDNDRLVASYSGGWQMRMCLGKILLKVRASVGCRCCIGLAGRQLCVCRPALVLFPIGKRFIQQNSGNL
jgi:hypothetical protein